MALRRLADDYIDRTRRVEPAGGFRPVLVVNVD